VGESEKSQLEELQKLLESRETLRKHLDTLEEKSALARPEIVEKVRRDYREQLARAEEALRESGLLQLVLSQLEKEISATEARIAALRDEEEEASFRYMIRELDEAGFQHVEGEKKAERAEQDSKLAALRDKAHFYEGILSGPTPPGQQPVAPTHEFLPSLEERATAPQQSPPPMPAVEGALGLTCPQCKTLNPSDNWFCEKCGKELIDIQKLFPGQS
jgi:hypothetical protein